MSSRELERVEVMGRVGSGALKLVHAAEMLELSYRQTKRLWRRTRELLKSSGLQEWQARLTRLSDQQVHTPRVG
jgi:hypothetical protein